MDTTLLYQILESKDGIEHTSLEQMENWLVQFPHNPVILKLIHSKKESLGIELNELDWNHLSLTTPHIDDFFIQLDYDSKLLDKHIDIETNAIEGDYEAESKSSGIDVSPQSADEIEEERIEFSSSQDSQIEPEKPLSPEIESNPDIFHISTNEIPEDQYEEETVIEDISLSNQTPSPEIENWTDEDDDDILIFEMEDIHENGEDDVKSNSEKPKNEGKKNITKSKPQLTDFTRWLKDKNPAKEQNFEVFGDYLPELEKVKKKKKKKSKKLKNKIKTKSGLLKKQYNIKINKRLKSVIEFADQSLLDPKDIISETFAEILVEQEHYSRAIDMYQRLSLAFPEKSVYFAEIIKKIQKK